MPYLIQLSSHTVCGAALIKDGAALMGSSHKVAQGFQMSFANFEIGNTVNVFSGLHMVHFFCITSGRETAENAVIHKV